MPYTERLVYTDLVQLALRKGMRHWTWEATSSPQSNPDASPIGFWKQLTSYCWTAYRKASHASGDMAIGRLPDLTNFKRRVCNIDTSKGQTLFDQAAKGNALEMDKWAPVMNDAWVLGGIHRYADFLLHSPRSFQNLWENSSYRVGMVVTARELWGLVNFGYVRQENAHEQARYVCANRELAQQADLLKYDGMMTCEERRDRASILKHMGLRDDLAADIRNFDKSTLKPVKS